MKPNLHLAPDANGGGALTENDFQAKVLGGVESLKSGIEKHGSDIAAAIKDIGELKGNANKLASDIDALRKAQIAQRNSGIIRPGHVSEECARHLGALAMVRGLRTNQIRGEQYEAVVKDVLGMEVRTAVAATDIPLPVAYAGEVAELVATFGAARLYGTTFPLGGGSVKLPRLKTDTAFGLIAQSGTLEVVPQTEWVTFSPEKFGGIVRIPSEIDADSVVAIGQFVARYAARQIAKCEDTQFFISTGAGSGANGSVKGLCLSTIDNSKVLQMASGKTKYSDVTLANLRALRAVPDAAALRTGAYYFHPSFEQALATLNSSGDRPYNPNAQLGVMNSSGVSGATPTLDGFPVRWVDIMPAYSTSANVSKVFGLFGDLSYQYLGLRGDVRFETSMEAGFTTDEILIRCLERMTIGLMATGAVAGVETAAS
jgi:HK97 family phage major capsid protein